MSEILFHKSVPLPDGSRIEYFTQIQRIYKNGSNTQIALPINMRIHIDKNGDWINRVCNDGRWNDYDENGRPIIKRKT